MEREHMVRRKNDLVDEQVSLDRIQKALAQRQIVVARQIEAYETLLELDPQPNAEALGLSELESLLGVSSPDDTEDEDEGETAQWLLGVEPSESSSSEYETDDEFAPFSDCDTIIEIADRWAALNDGTVYVAKVTDVAEACGFANPDTKRPRKQLWIKVYSALKKSERYEYGGRGTGKFTQRQASAGSAPLDFES